MNFTFSTFAHGSVQVHRLRYACVAPVLLLLIHKKKNSTAFFKNCPAHICSQVLCPNNNNNNTVAIMKRFVRFRRRATSTARGISPKFGRHRRRRRRYGRQWTIYNNIIIIRSGARGGFCVRKREALRNDQETPCWALIKRIMNGRSRTGGGNGNGRRRDFLARLSPLRLSYNNNNNIFL